MKKWIVTLLAGAILIPAVLFAGCVSDGGDIQFTNPVIDSGDPDTAKNPFPGLNLEYYSDDQSEDQSQKKAVVVTSLEKIRDEMIDSGLDIQSLEYSDMSVSKFDNGFVADINMKIELTDGKTADRHVLGYFKTVRMPDGTYRTYFVYYNDIKPDEKVDDQTKEELLDEVIGQIKPSGGAASSASSKEENANSSQASSAPSSSQAQGSSSPDDIDNISDNPEPISDVDVDTLF